MMDWNAKWDWENFALFGSKVTEIPKKLPFADFFIGDDGELDTGSFNQSTGGGGNSGASGSDGWHASSAKSSISASTESSTKDALHTPPSFRLMTTEDASKNISMVIDNADVYGTSAPPEASVGSLEPLIGLKLGKRTYFENNVAAGSVKTSAFLVRPSGTCSNKSKLLGQVRPTSRCVVEGCNLDLSTAKDYHRKHRVCESHSKCSKVVVGGFERRFCQQCSRFHNLAEFDDKKRSCRRRLLDHNARRRKPQPENLTSLSSSLYGRRETSFLLNNAPHFFSRNYPSTTWDSTCNSIPALKLSNVTNLHSNTPSGLFASKNSMHMLDAPNPNPGSKVSWASSHVDTAPEYGRALSLLSANSWGSCGPESTTQYYSLHENFHSVNQPIMHAIPEGLPLSSPELLLPIHQAGSVQPRDGQAIQFCRTAYESDFYSNHPV